VQQSNESTSNSKKNKPPLMSGRGLPLIMAVLSLFLIWEIAAYIWNKPYILPTVEATFVYMWKQLQTPEFVKALSASSFRLVVGYPAACFIGAALGLLAGLSKGFKSYLRSLIAILQAIPPIVWVPFFTIILGYGHLPIIIVILIASFFPMALSVMNATESVNKTHLELAMVMGANRRQLLTKVFTPETLPAVITGAQVSFGNAWRSLVSSEMVTGAAIGLGFNISSASEIANMKGVLMGIVVIGGIAVFLDLVVLEWIKRKVLRYRYVTGGNP